MDKLLWKLKQSELWCFKKAFQSK